MADILSIESLNAKLDLYLPATGDIGYWCLLNDTFTTALGFTVDAGADELTTVSDHNLVTGTRVRFTVSGVGAVLPSVSGITEATLLPSKDYYAISTGSDTLQVANTQADALANSPINITSSGSGTFELTEQPLVVSDPVEVLLNHELSAFVHLDYARYLWTASGAAANAAKPTLTWAQIVSASRLIPLTYRYKLLMKGGTSTIGDVTGEKSYLVTEQARVTVPIGQQINLSVTVKESNQSGA